MALMRSIDYLKGEVSEGKGVREVVGLQSIMYLTLFEPVNKHYI